MTEHDIEKIKMMINEVNNFDKHQLTEAIYWMILGDGCIEQKERGNYNLSVSHNIKHEDYITWKAAIIDRVTGFSVNYQKIKGGFSDSHEMLRLRSAVHPWFTKSWNRIYGILGRKTIDPYAVNLLSPLGLAILYQDDGSLNTTNRQKDNRPNSWIERNVLIHKMCFSKYELEGLAKAIVNKFGLIFRINENKGKGFGYRLRLRSKDIDNFFSLINPYIVPSMSYKVGRGSND